MYQTLAVAVGVLYLGGFLKKKVRFLETFCIPSPVIGGVIFAIISCILHVAGIVEKQFAWSCSSLLLAFRQTLKF